MAEHFKCKLSAFNFGIFTTRAGAWLDNLCNAWPLRSHSFIPVCHSLVHKTFLFCKFFPPYLFVLLRDWLYVLPGLFTILLSISIVYFLGFFALNLWTLAFSALALLGGRQEGHRVMGCWCGHLSAVRCRLFANGPADATASQNRIISCFI